MALPILLNNRIKEYTITIKANNCNPKAKLENLFSISFDKNSIPTPNKRSNNGDVDLKNDKNLVIAFYLKNESTNSNLLNTCKSSIFSPTPIYFTGI